MSTDSTDAYSMDAYSNDGETFSHTCIEEAVLYGNVILNKVTGDEEVVRQDGEASTSTYEFVQERPETTPATINVTRADLRAVCDGILNDCIEDGGGYTCDSCLYCFRGAHAYPGAGTGIDSIDHAPDCPVLIARDIRPRDEGGES